jgi:hypothetical protein
MALSLVSLFESYIRLATVLSFISHFSSAVGEAIIKLIEAMY